MSGDLALFDIEPQTREPEPPESGGRRRTRRQMAALLARQHPLSLLPGSRPIRLHPDAPSAEDRKAPGPRCGGCLFSVRNGWSYIKCTRGRTGEIYTPSFRRGPFETASTATDLRAWWPGCLHWEAAEAAR